MIVDHQHGWPAVRAHAAAQIGRVPSSARICSALSLLFQLDECGTSLEAPLEWMVASLVETRAAFCHWQISWRVSSAFLVVARKLLVIVTARGAPWLLVTARWIVLAVGLLLASIRPANLGGPLVCRFLRVELVVVRHHPRMRMLLLSGSPMIGRFRRQSILVVLA